MHTDNHERHAAMLHDCTRRVSHPDSEKAVRSERQRVARELESFGHRTTSNASGLCQDNFSRTREASQTLSIASNAPLQNRISLESYDTTQPDVTCSRSSSIRTIHWYSPVLRFWTTHVSLTIDEGAHRDHLALERTFLGYLRTSLLLVMTGVIIAQLFRIQRAVHPNPDIGFYVIGKPLSATFIGTAIFVLLIGAYRFWRLQDALVRGKALKGGWEIFAIMALSALLLVATFALVLAVNIDKAR